MNITLPDEVVKKLAKVPNKSAFIAAALADKFERQRRDERQRKLLEAYRWVAEHPEYEKDARPDW